MIKVSDYIAKFFYAKGVRHVFMVTGGGAMHLNDSLARSQPFEVTFNHHEQASAIAAEGLYRASGQVGVVNVTTGPGGLNAVSGLMGQWTDSVPVIYLSGQVKFETTLMSCPSIPLRQLGDQEVDIISVVKPLTKWAISVVDPQNIRQACEKAWKLATTGRFGPVWLDIPMNVQGALVDEQALIGLEETLKSEFPSGAQLILDELSRSKRPVIVAGHGIRLAGVIPQFERLAELWGIPVLTTFNGFDLLPHDSSVYVGRIGTLGTRGGNFALQNADLVLCLGTRNNIRQVSYNWENFAHRARRIVVDIDLAELQKPTVKPTHAVQNDLSSLIPELLALGSSVVQKSHKEWLSWARERAQRYPGARPDQYAETSRINPYAFMETFTRSLTEKDVVVAGNGTACVALFQSGVVKAGQRYFWNSGCASMGYDLPAAVGACVGLGQPIWCLAGDGSLQMNLQELATVSHRNLPIKLVYLNNGGYASIRQTQTNFFQSQYGCGIQSGLGFPNMEKLSTAYGIPYFHSSSIDEVAATTVQVGQTAGPAIWEIELKLDYSFEPKLSSERLPDGRMVSKPLEDLWPFLPREEFESNMIRD